MSPPTVGTLQTGETSDTCLPPSCSSIERIAGDAMWGDFTLSDFLEGNFLDGEIIAAWYQGSNAIF
jgi:hypothetical protein